MKQLKKDIKINQYDELYNELAEKRAIEMLGLTKEQILIAKAFETTKAFELNTIKKEIQKKNNEKLTWRNMLFGRPN